MARTADRDARLLEQMARGRRTRYTATRWIQIADDRAADDADSAIVADVIRGQTVAIPIFIAPCVGKVVRCGANATQYPTIAASTVTLRFYKAVIGAGNTALDTAATTVSGLTADTSVDATLSTTAGVTDLLEGQLVYCDVVAANQDITAKSLGMSLMCEFVPLDQRD